MFGLVHRHHSDHDHDQPENALIDSNGHLKISDFGTVKDEKEATRCNTFCGTAAYVLGLPVVVVVGGG